VHDEALPIAFVVLGFPPDVGGTELYNVEYARRLHARGHDLRLFTWSEGRAEESGVDASLPFDVHREPARRQAGAIHPQGLKAWLAAGQPRVAFVSRASKLMRAVVPVVARHAPVVLSVHELGGRHTRRGPLGRLRIRRRYGLDRAQRIVVNSEDTGRRVATLRAAAPISVVHPGVDTASFATDDLQRDRARAKLGLTDRPVLLTVSRLAANKGHARVIAALPALRERFPDLVYLIVGQGGERDALASHAAELGVAEAVRFEGRVDDTRLYYAACDVFVMPSGRDASGKAGEGFGISYAEAGACAVPVVAGAVGGGAEVVVDGETGHLVDPSAPRVLEEAIGGLLADPEKARQMGEAGRRHCARFDWERGADALEALLREVAAA
jgi:phosphatidylinositol alpha-1,6-mannosyltransferase